MTANRTGKALAAVSAIVVGLGLLSDGARADPPAPQIPDHFDNADELLTTLETADQGISSLRADVQLVRDFGPVEGNQKQKRRGRLYFRNGDRPGDKAFRVDFDMLLVPPAQGDAWVERDEKESYIFDGRDLVELRPEKGDPDRGLAVIRQIAPPGERVDPLRIGQGPFPLPIGQKREEILKRFDVELDKPGAGFKDGKVPPMLRGTVQLRLIPKPGTAEARDFNEIRIWYFRYDQDGDGKTDRLLPRMARTINTGGGSSDVQLINVVANTDLPDGLFNVKVPAGWEVHREPFRGAAEGQGEPPAADAPKAAEPSGQEQ